MAKQNATEPATKSKQISVDEAEFIRTRDALITSLTKLGGSIQSAVHAYIDHSNSVLDGKAALDLSLLNVFGIPSTTASNGAVESAVKDEAAGPEDKKKRKRTVKPKDPNAPKRPLTAYLLFLDDMRPIIQSELGEGQKRGDISAEGTRRWHKLSSEEQQKFKDRYKESYQQYLQALSEYKSKGGVVPPDAEAPEEDDVPSPIVADVSKAKAKVDIDDDSTSSVDSSTDDDSSDEEAPAPKEPTPPPVKTPRKGRKPAAAPPASSPPAPAATASAKGKKGAASAALNGAAKEMSPALKRKAEAAEETKQKKSKKEAAVKQASVVAESPKKEKKERKKPVRRSVGGEA